MSYTLKLTNGKILLTLADQQSDRITTSLTMIGKNVNAYGTDLNDNFVHLLENFANNVEPVNPLEGQLWFDTANQVTKVYKGIDQSFHAVGGPIISATRPPLVAGDLWIDSANRKLKFYDGNNLIDSGIPYNYTEGKSGLLIEDSTTTSIGSTRFLGVYINDSLLGIYSDTDFDFNSSYSGIQNVYRGFTANAGIKFIGTATSADGILSSTGTVITADQLLRSDLDPYFTVPVTLYTDNGIKIGESLTSGEIQIWQTGTSITSSTIFTESIKVATFTVNGVGQDFNLEINPLPISTPPVSSIYLDATNTRLGIFNTRPTTDVDITGNVNINGNLSILGSSTFVTSYDLRVDDKTIELAYTTGTSTDVYANGGGIVLHGTSDKNILWNSDNSSWTSNQNFDIIGYSKTTTVILGSSSSTTITIDDASDIVPSMLVDGPNIPAGTTIVSVLGNTVVLSATVPPLPNPNDPLPPPIDYPYGPAYIRDMSSTVLNFTYSPRYKINGVDVIQSGSLSTSITAAPGLISVGTLTNLNVAQVFIYGSTVTTSVSGPLYIGDNTPTYIDFNGKQLFNAATPDFAPSSSTWVTSQVATKKYVDDRVAVNRYIGNYSNTIDVTGFAIAVNDPALDPYVISMLELMYPPNELPPYDITDGSRARIMVTRYQTRALNNVPSDYLNPGNPVLVDSNGVPNSVEAIEYSTFLRTTTDIPATLVTVNRAIKQYQVSGGVWVPLNLPNSFTNTVYTDGTW